MKIAIALVAGLAAAANAQFTNLIISEIVDAPLPGGLPKFVELTNTGSTDINLAGLSLGNFNNGGTTLGGGAALALSGTIAAGDSFVVNFEAGDAPGVGTFFDVYGFDPDNFEQGAFFNGDDVFALFDGLATGDGSDATILDIFGVIGVDGTGEAWEYTDSFAFRNEDVLTGNGGIFDLAEWTFGGADGLEDPNGDDAIELQNILAETTPGTHNFIPAPAGFAGLGFAGLAAARRRRA